MRIYTFNLLSFELFFFLVGIILFSKQNYYVWIVVYTEGLNHSTADSSRDILSFYSPLDSPKRSIQTIYSTPLFYVATILRLTSKRHYRLRCGLDSNLRCAALLIVV